MARQTQLLDDNERELWSGRPNAALYIIGNPLFYVFAAVWLLFDLRLFGSFQRTGAAGLGSMASMLTPFFLLHLAPVWLAIGGLIYRACAWHKIQYILTDRRIYQSSGLLGTDVSTLELREVSHLSVNVNPIENALGLGTIRLTPDVSVGSGDNARTVSGYRLRHIKDPYNTYNLIKRVSLDVSTDQQFPNAYRPSENPGYDTRLK